MFEVDGLPPGAYAVVMLEQEGCEGAGDGRVYRRPGDPDSDPAGAFGDCRGGGGRRDNADAERQTEFLSARTAG